MSARQQAIGPPGRRPDGRASPGFGRATRMTLRHPIVLGAGANLIAWMLFGLLITALYFAWLRDYQMNWGATDQEVRRRMAGDELLDDPGLNATRAVEIDAPPSHVWPWIVQMGYRRAGFYGFDKLDNGGYPSASHIIRECQDLSIGDSITLGGPRLRIAEMDPGKSMLWVFEDAGPWEGATWSWGLYTTKDGHTRLVSRLRHEYSFESAQEVIAWSLVDAIEILMMRTTLLGIKRRAENICPDCRAHLDGSPACSRQATDCVTWLARAR